MLAGSARAFALPEAMVAVLAFALMIAALYASFTYGFGAVKLAREDLRATQILVERLERVRLTSFQEIPSSSTSTELYDPRGAADGEGGAVYSISITATTPTGADMPMQPVYYMNKMLKIVATATWTNGSVLRTRTVQTYAAQHGIQPFVYTPQP